MLRTALTYGPCWHSCTYVLGNIADIIIAATLQEQSMEWHSSVSKKTYFARDVRSATQVGTLPRKWTGPWRMQRADGLPITKKSHHYSLKPSYFRSKFPFNRLWVRLYAQVGLLHVSVYIMPSLRGPSTPNSIHSKPLSYIQILSCIPSILPLAVSFKSPIYTGSPCIVRV